MSGAAAGAARSVSILMTYPLDTIKVRNLRGLEPKDQNKKPVRTELLKPQPSTERPKH